MSSGNAVPQVRDSTAPGRERLPNRRLAGLLGLWPVAALALGGLATFAWIALLAWVGLWCVLWTVGFS